MQFEINTNCTAPLGLNSILFRMHPPMKMPIQAPGMAIEPEMELLRVNVLRFGVNDFTGENTGLAFSQAELCFQIFRQEHHESGHYDEFHAGSQAGYYVNRIARQSPH